MREDFVVSAANPPDGAHNPNPSLGRSETACQRYQSIPYSKVASGYQKAPASVRKQILACLRDPDGWRVYDDGQRYLDLHGLDASVVIEDLADDLDAFEIFILPKSHPTQRQKFQYVIRYSDPDLFIHVKMTPTDFDPPLVYLGFHPHNIPGPPLPQIPLTPEPESFDEEA